MRTLPASVTAILSSGPIEAINILRVYWSDTPVLYADKEYKDYGVKGKILNLSTIEDVRDLNRNVLDVQFEVTLDDTDDEFKTIITNRDINNVKVELLQWFAEVPFSDAFKIFEGTINSPITYSDGASQITFTVLNSLENREFGFSAEEGQFPYLPPTMVGKAWPVVFGKVASVPLPQIAEAPSVITAEGFGIVNDAAWDNELAQLYAQLALANANRQAAFLLGVQEAYKAAQFEDPFGFGSFGVSNDPSAAQSHREASRQAFASAEQYAQDAFTISQEITARLAERREQEATEKTSIRIVGTNLPNGIPLTFRLNDVTITGIVVGDRLNITSQTVNRTLNTTRPLILSTNTNTLGTYSTELVGEKFYWIDGGTKIFVKNFIVSHVIATTQVTVATIKAKQNGVYVKVPTSYYTIEYPTYTSALTGQTINPTILRLYEPLTAKNDDALGIRWDDDSVFADVVSPVGPNIVDILIWIIQNYTTLSYDATTFTHVRALVDTYSANFAVTERANAIDLLRDVAYQARCAIWTNDEKFYIRYLPEKQTSSVTLTLDDVELSSIELYSETTEDLVTKYVAEWRPSLDYPDPYKVIYRYNIEKYGTREETYEYFIYNNVEAVKKSAEYWLMKSANAWKHVRFNVSYEQFALEAFDPVTIDFNMPWICATPVVGIIERAVLDTTENKISLEVWLPVRMGEPNEYVYASPKDVYEVYPKRGDDQIKTGNPLQGVTGQLVNKLQVLGTTGQGVNYESAPDNFFGNAAGRDDVIADAADVNRNFGGVSTFLNPAEIVNNRPTRLLDFNNGKRYDVKKFTQEGVSPPSSATYAGTVIDYFGSGVYLVETYTKGLSNNPETVRVKQWGHVDDDDLIGAGTPVAVVRLTNVAAGNVGYIMFCPVWCF